MDISSVGHQIKVMNFPVSIISRPIIGKFIALQSFFFARPKLDIDLVIDSCVVVELYLCMKNVTPANKIEKQGV